MLGFVELTVAGVRWRVAEECRDALFDADGLRLPEWLRDGRAEVVKHSSHRTVYRVNLPGLRFYLKHNRAADTRARLREWLRKGKAQSECDAALALAGRGVPAVVPLAAGAPCRGRGDS